MSPRFSLALLFTFVALTATAADSVSQLESDAGLIRAIDRLEIIELTLDTLRKTNNSNDARFRSILSEQEQLAKETVTHLRTRSLLEKVRHDLIARWFSLKVSQSALYQRSFNEYLGLFYLLYPESLLDVLQMRGLLGVSIDRMANSPDPREAIVALASDWLEGQKILMQSEEFAQRRKIINLIERYWASDPQRGTDILKSFSELAATLPPGTKMLLARDVISINNKLLRDSLWMEWLAMVPIETWIHEDPELLRKVIQTMGRQNITLFDIFLKQLVTNPKIANETSFSIQPSLSQKAGNTSELPLIDQFFLLKTDIQKNGTTSYFQDRIMTSLLRQNSKESRSILHRLLSRVHEFDLPISEVMLKTLNTTGFYKHPYWWDLVMRTSTKTLVNPSNSLLFFASNRQLMADQSDAAFALQSKLFVMNMKLIRDRRTKKTSPIIARMRSEDEQMRLAVQKKNLELNSMAKFISSAIQNPRLREAFIKGWGVEVLLSADEFSTVRMLDKFFFHPDIHPKTRILWLEAFLSTRPQNPHIIERFAEAFEIKSSDELKTENRLMGLSELVVLDANPALSASSKLRCKSFFTQALH